MRLDIGQQMRTDQRMKLAPRMIQAMEILQMPEQALEQRVEQELSSNPTLELREPGADREALHQEREQDERDSRESERELVVGEAGEATSSDDFERLSNFSEQYGEAWESDRYETGTYTGPGRGVARRAAGERDGKMDALANTAARSASLYDQLLDQWRFVETTPALGKAGEYLIGFIDADGYIRVDEQTLLHQKPAGLTADDLHAAWKLLQQELTPPGLAARDLRECLLLQIDAAGESPDAPTRAPEARNGAARPPASDLGLERELVSNHLKDIERNRLPRIARALDLPIERVKQAMGNLRRFHPHPGRLLADETPRTIRPDAVVEYDEQNDTYTARLTRGQTPPLHISRTYEQMAKNRRADKNTRNFVSRNLNSARWLIDAIEQRSATLLRVIGVVLAHQREWFDQGPEALRPLPMTLVADQLGIHVATVSRAVNEKYLQTPRGIVPLRMFFSGGTQTESGESMSWTAVQATLEQIVEEEDKSAPLSDDQLVEALEEKGIDIARRTVAKYRKQLSIPTARQRREY